MEENKFVKVKATMIASFPRGQWENEIKFDVELTVNCERDRVGAREILTALLERVGLCSMGEQRPYLFLLADGRDTGPLAINIAQVNYFDVDDWMFIDDEEEK